MERPKMSASVILTTSPKINGMTPISKASLRLSPVMKESQQVPNV